MLSTNLRMCMYINFNRYSEVEREAIQLFVISWYSHQSQSIFWNPYRKKMGDEICFDIEISVKIFCMCIHILYYINKTIFHIISNIFLSVDYTSACIWFLFWNLSVKIFVPFQISLHEPYMFKREKQKIENFTT